MKYNLTIPYVASKLTSEALIFTKKQLKWVKSFSDSIGFVLIELPHVKRGITG